MQRKVRQLYDDVKFWVDTLMLHPFVSFVLSLKGLSHEIDFKNVDENGQILALTRAAAGF